MNYGNPISINGTIVATGTPVEVFDSGQSWALLSVTIYRLLDCVATVNHVDADGNVFPISPTASFSFDSDSNKRFAENIILNRENQITFETDTASSLKYHIQGFYLSDTTVAIPPNSELIARYNFDQVTGTTFHDATGSNDGTLVAPATFAQWSKPEFENGISFLGVDGYATIPHSTDFSIDTTGELTVAFYLQTGNNVTAKGGVISKSIHPTFEWQTYIESGYFVAVINTVSGGTVRRERAPVVANKIYFISVEFTGPGPLDEINIYIDNTKKNELIQNVPANSYTAGTVGVRMGLNTDGVPNYYYGDILMDELYILPRLLTDGERLAIYEKFQGA